MKLQKWFRKNQRPMLAGFGALLVVGWLLGDALMSLLKGSGASGTLAVSRKYGVFSADDVLATQNVHKLLEMLAPGFQWERPVGGRIPTQPLSLADWIALEREAASNGFRVTGDAIAERYRDEVSAARLQEISHRNRVRQELLLSAAGTAVQITEFAQFCAATAVPSLAEVRQIVTYNEERARIDAVVFPAKAFEDPTTPVQEDQLLALFEKYRNNQRGEGLDFGYMLPDAVKVEYIEVDAREVLANLRVDAAKLERDARKFWEDNPRNAIFRKKTSAGAGETGSPVLPEAFQLPAEPLPSPEGMDAVRFDQDDQTEPEADDNDGNRGGGPRVFTVDAQESAKPEKKEGKEGKKRERARDSDSQEPAGSATSESDIAANPPPSEPSGDESSSTKTPPADATMTKPAAPKPAVEYCTTWEEAREAALDHIRKVQTTTVVNDILNWLQPRLAEPWIGLATGPDGYKIAPDQVKAEGYYQRIVDQALRSFPYPTAIRVNQTPLFSPRDIPQVGDIGLARVMVQGRSRTENLVNLAFRVQGLVPFPRSGDRSYFLSLYETSRFTLVNPTAEKKYLFRVIEVRPRRPPASLDEVRDQVVSDLRLKMAFDAARQEADKLIAAAKSSTLKDAYEADEALVRRSDVGVAFIQPRPFAHSVSTDTGELMSRENLKMNIVGVGMVSLPIIEQIFALENVKPPMTVLALEELSMVVAVEFKERIPAHMGHLAKFRTATLQSLINNRTNMAKELLLKPDNVRARAGIEISE